MALLPRSVSDSRAKRGETTAGAGQVPSVQHFLPPSPSKHSHSDCSKSNGSVISVLPFTQAGVRTQGFLCLWRTSSSSGAAARGAALSYLAPAHGAHALDELPGLQLERSAPLHLLVPQLHCSPLLRAAKDTCCYMGIPAGIFCLSHRTGTDTPFTLHQDTSLWCNGK